jgi:hypothetical protein
MLLMLYFRFRRGCKNDEARCISLGVIGTSKPIDRCKAHAATADMAVQCTPQSIASRHITTPQGQFREPVAFQLTVLIRAGILAYLVQLTIGRSSKRLRLYEGNSMSGMVYFGSADGFTRTG